MKSRIGIFSLLIFVVLNAILLGGQYVYQYIANYGDNQRLDRINAQLTAERPQIDALENEVAMLRDQISKMDKRLVELDKEIVSTESRYPNGVPSNLYQEYKGKVEEFNALLNTFKQSRSESDVKYAEYTRRVDSYNVLVNEGKSLAQKLRTTYYFILKPR